MTRNATWLEVRAARRAQALHGSARPNNGGASGHCGFSALSFRSPPLTPRVPHLNAQQAHVDYLSLQALLFKHTTLGFAGQIRLFFFRHTRRIAD